MTTIKRLDDLSYDEQTRMFADRNWLYDDALRLFFDRSDGETMTAYMLLNAKRVEVRKLEEAKTARMFRALEQMAYEAGTSPEAVWRQVEAERSYAWSLRHGYDAARLQLINMERLRKGLPVLENLPGSEAWERKSAPLVLEVKDVKDGNSSRDGMLRGYLAAWSLDQVGDTIAPTAFDASLLALRQKPYSQRFLLPMLLQHDSKRPIGGFTELIPDAKGLAFQARIDMATRDGSEAYSGIRNGYLRGMSIGFAVERSKRTNEGRLLQQIRLTEGSLVTFAANPDAAISETLF